MCTFIYERIYMKFLALHENAARGTSDFPIELYYVDRSHPRYEMPFHWHLEYEMMLDFLIKSSTDKAEKNFAVPFVGRTWFGPAK